MTFAEYNTDDNYDNKNGFESSLEELVKLGLEEGKTSDDIKSSLSPKWQKSKKIDEFDNYVSKYSKPKEEKKETEKPKEEAAKENDLDAIIKEEIRKDETPDLDKKEEQFYDEQKKYSDKAEAETLKNIDKKSDYNWQKEYETTSRMSDAYKRIDDKMVNQLPTFMLKRYMDGEFGDPKSSDAKLRLAYFIINGVQTALRRFSNGAALAAGKAPLYANEMSEYEKYQATNLEQGLQNRWNKYKQETQAAIDLATKEGMNEQEARLAIEQLTRDKTANTLWNMMDSNQKIYAMEVTKKIGDALGDMDISELGNFIAGAAYEGTADKDKVAAIGIAKLAANAPEILDNLQDGNIKDMVMGMIGGNPSFEGASIGGGLLSGSGKKETGATLEDGTDIDAGKIMTGGDFDKIKTAAEKLGNQYYNGEIDEKKFRSEYAKLEAEMSKHNIYNKAKNIMSADDYLKQIHRNKLNEIGAALDELNANAKNMSTKDYEEQYEDLKANAKKWGIDEKSFNGMEKEKNKAIKKTKK